MVYWYYYYNTVLDGSDHVGELFDHEGEACKGADLLENTTTDPVFHLLINWFFVVVVDFM